MSHLEINLFNNIYFLLNYLVFSSQNINVNNDNYIFSYLVYSFFVIKEKIIIILKYLLTPFYLFMCTTEIIKSFEMETSNKNQNKYEN